MGWLETLGNIGLAIGGAILGSYFGGIYFGPFGQMLLTSAGFMAGSMLGSMVFPQDLSSNTKMPSMSGFPLQSSQKGIPVPIVFGTTRVAGNIVWMGDLQTYTIEHKVGETGGGMFGGGDDITISETRYRRSFLIGVCEGPAKIRRLWKGKDLVPITDSHLTWYEGEENSGIPAALGAADYGGGTYEFCDYKHLACMLFTNFELGNGQQIPNFVFEITTAPPDLTVWRAETGAFYTYEGLDLEIKIDAGGLAVDAGAGVVGRYVQIPIRRHPFNVGDTFTICGSSNYEEAWGGGNSHYTCIDSSYHDVNHIVLDRWPAFAAETFSGEERVIRMRGGLFNNDAMAGDIVRDADGNWYVPALHAAGDSCLYKLDKDLNQEADFFSPGGGEANGWHGAAQFGLGVKLSPDGAYLYLSTVDPIYLYKFDLSDGSLEWAVAGLKYGGRFDIDSNGRLYFPGSDVNFKGARIDGADGSIDFYFEDLDLDVYAPTQGILAGSRFVVLLYNNWADPKKDHNVAIFADDGELLYSVKLAVGNEMKLVHAGIYLNGFIYCIGDYNADGNNVWKISTSGDVVAAAAIDGAPRSIHAGYGGEFYLLRETGFIYGDEDALVRMSGVDLSIIEEINCDPGEVSVNFTNCNYGLVKQELDLPYDENFVAMIEALVKKERWGAGILNIEIDQVAFDNAWRYCEDNNLKGSMALTEQRSLWDWVDFICSHFNGYRHWSEGKLSVGVFKDEASVASVDQDDLVIGSGAEPAPPVQIKKRKFTETFNRINILWSDRENDYDQAVAVVNDEVDQRVSLQVRETSINLTGITNAGLALSMAYRYLIDSMYRLSFYTFILAYKNMLLEVGDVIDISDGHLLTSQRAKNGRGLNIEAVEDIAGLYPEITYTTERTLAEPFILPDPGSSSIQFREDPNNSLVYLSVFPGDANVNGWFFYISFDDVTYNFLGRSIVGDEAGDLNVSGPLVNSLPAYPSVVHRPAERLCVNIGTAIDMSSASDVLFFGGLKLAKIGDEILGYKTCTETSSGSGIWEIVGLIRGLFGTEPAAHAVGETFYSMDPNFTYDFDPADIGQTVYFKAVTFYGSNVEDIDDVTGYSYQIRGLVNRPEGVSLIRLTSDENDVDAGGAEYSGPSFSLYWNLGSKETGFNKGGIDVHPDKTIWRFGDSEAELLASYGVPYGNYLADVDLQAIDLQFEQTGGTVIGQRALASTAETATITKATDLGGNDPAVVKVIPRRALQSEAVHSITVDQS
jgi:hypothetical protein